MSGSDSFQFFIPLAKSGSASGERKRPVNGLASAEVEDQMRETVLQKGMDFKPFLDGGLINWNHLSGPENLIGEPVAAEVRQFVRSDMPEDLRRGMPDTFWGFWIDGELYENHQRADAVWALMKAMESNGGRRRLGWSVEGGIVQRHGGRIVRSIVTKVALTEVPVLQVSFAQLAKSFCCGRCVPGSDNFDPEHAMHHCEHAQFVKALDTAGAVALRREHVAGVTAPSSWIWDDCQHNHFDPITGLFPGRSAFFDHLVLCRGMSEDEAADLIYKLASSLRRA